jgi:hypothetical protein
MHSPLLLELSIVTAITDFGQWQHCTVFGFHSIKPPEMNTIPPRLKLPFDRPQSKSLNRSYKDSWFYRIPFRN